MGQKLGKIVDQTGSDRELNGRFAHGIVVRMESPTPPSLPDSPAISVRRDMPAGRSLKYVVPPSNLSGPRRKTLGPTPRLSPLISLHSVATPEEEELCDDPQLIHPHHDYVSRKSRSLSGSPMVTPMLPLRENGRRRISEVTPALRKLSQYIAIPRVNLTVSPYQIVALQQGWAAARAKGFGQPAHSVFIKFATQSTEIQRILEQKAKSSESLMTVHVKAFLDLMDFCLDHLDDEGEVRKHLLLVGQRHSHFRQAGFKPKFWDQLAEVLVSETLKWRPKRGRNLETQAWTNVVLYMIGTMNEGYENERLHMRDLSDHVQ